jgi:hypothetical protein
MATSHSFACGFNSINGILKKNYNPYNIFMGVESIHYLIDS